MVELAALQVVGVVPNAEEAVHVVCVIFFVLGSKVIWRFSGCLLPSLRSVKTVTEFDVAAAPERELVAAHLRHGSVGDDQVVVDFVDLA